MVKRRSANGVQRWSWFVEDHIDYGLLSQAFSNGRMNPRKDRYQRMHQKIGLVDQVDWVMIRDIFFPSIVPECIDYDKILTYHLLIVQLLKTF